MTKILITGSDSFVGTNFRKLSRYKDVDEVSLVGKKPEDICFSGYDVVFHVAAIVHQSKKIPESEYMHVNRDLCLRVAEHAKRAGVRQFIFMSTLKVYGDDPDCNNIRNEESECHPDDFYGKSKYEAETGLQKYNGTDFTVSIIRPPLVYGQGVKANMLRIVKLVKYFPLLPFKNCDNRRDFVYIENLVGYIDRIIETQKEGTFIVKDENAVSTTELVLFLAGSLRKRVILFKLPGIFLRIGTFFAPAIFTRLYCSFEFDNTKTKRELNYSPPYSTEEGIKKWISSDS